MVMPFTGRVAEVNAELDQYVREGEVLAMVDGMQRAEVEVHIPIEQMSNLVRSDREVDLLSLSSEALKPALGLQAVVRLKEGALQADWRARFARISDTLDPKTRTVGVIVEVDEPYAKVQPGIRPPLFKGLFVQVDLYGRPRPDSLVIPRLALTDSLDEACMARDTGCADKTHIYVVGDGNHLEIRDVEVGLIQDEYVVIEAGLSAGEQVVVSDLLPAIQGMLLEPVADEAAESRLIRVATSGIE
jgi:multidrug efflux pump subunit AcrA (membrane-fusion protein)